jgi:uncharacterized protein (DUF433 family)
MSASLCERIEINEGSAVLRGRAMPVDRVLDLLACGASFEEIMELYGSLRREDILACIEYAYSK